MNEVFFDSGYFKIQQMFFSMAAMSWEKYCLTLSCDILMSIYRLSCKIPRHTHTAVVILGLLSFPHSCSYTLWALTKVGHLSEKKHDSLERILDKPWKWFKASSAMYCLWDFKQITVL